MVSMRSGASLRHGDEAWQVFRPIDEFETSKFFLAASQTALREAAPTSPVN